MRLIYIRLENYIGIYNGRGDNILEVDLSQSTSNIIIIRGSNGSGKSTLLKALSPLQDDNTAIIPGLEGTKSLRYLYNGEVYEIVYIHPVKSDGSRGQVKLQIYKGNKREELNPTWNVTSGKDIIFDLFNLDANFLTLSQLSSEDRGLADKKPAERKKFVNSIINGIEVYNNMYKVVTKKYSNFKSMISTISSKIAQIGNIEELNVRFNNITRQVELVSAERDQAILETAKLDSQIELLSKDNNLETYYNAEKSLRELKATVDKDINTIIDICKGEIPYTTDTTEIYELINRNLEKSNTEVKQVISDEAKASTKLDSLTNEKTKVYEELQVKITKRDSILDNSFSESDLNLYNESKAKISEIDREIKSLNLNIKNTSEAESLINAVEMIVPVIDTLYNGLDSTTRKDKSNFVRSTLDNNRNYVNQLPIISEEHRKLSRELLDLESELRAYEILFDKAKGLALRPKECKIDSCAYVKEAIDASSKNPESRIDSINKEISEINKMIKELESKSEFYTEVYDFWNRFNNLHGMIMSFRKLLDKTPISYILDPYNLLESLDNMEKVNTEFNRIRGIYNIMITKDKYEDILESLKEPAIKYEANKSLIEELDSNISDLRESLSKINNDILEESEKVQSLKYKHDVLDYKIEAYTNSYDIINKVLSDLDDIKELENKMSSLSDIAKQVSGLQVDLDSAKEKSNRLNEQLNMILQDRDSIASNKTLLEDYQGDLDLYNKNFSILEAVRYYLSPTTGIQTVFMRTYMGNIILKANELLSLIFNGQFIIQPFVINEAEFRIPCLGNGLLNDDISSMSTSQICMISMILSFAILSNSSTDYNILKLDEIDGGLDTENRIQFIGLLKQLIAMVGCEQCFLISHNMEYDADTSVIDMTARPVMVR